MKSRSVIGDADKPDLPPLHLDQVLGDAQSQASASDLSDLGIFRSKELLEDLLLIFRADSYACVLHQEMNYLAGPLRVP